MGIAVGDYNHTGRPSLYVTNFSDENDLLYMQRWRLEFQGGLVCVGRSASIAAVA